MKELDSIQNEREPKKENFNAQHCERRNLALSLAHAAWCIIVIIIMRERERASEFNFYMKTVFRQLPELRRGEANENERDNVIFFAKGLKCSLASKL
jgi:hypothetical protein